MTAASAPARMRNPLSAARSVPDTATARLLRLELRRSPLLWLIPLMAVLFYIDTYRTAMGYAAVWGIRASAIGNHLVPDLVPFAAGLCAWTGSRDGRCRMSDLLRATARPVWARRCAGLAASFCWMMAIYLCLVAVLYAVTAQQATWGGPPLWPVAVGAAELAAACAVGFAAGAFVPSRFTAPLAAVGTFLIVIVGFNKSLTVTAGYGLLSPMTSVPNFDAGVFYHSPDLPIVQLMFLGGIAVVAAGVLGFGLAGSARLATHGVIIPALHDSASDHPVAYTPACEQAHGIPVCVHPAFSASLPDVTAALAPLLSQVAGLPGAPTRVQEIATRGGLQSPLMGAVATVSGSPPVFSIPIPDPMEGKTAVTASTQTAFVTAFIAGSGAYVELTGTPAQQAVELALLTKSGWHEPPHAPAPAADVAAAASKFGSMPAAARHAWLASHLAALRAGQISLEQLP
jgi:hypothetical protein